MNERGSALLIVLWVVLLASVIALAIGYQLELETTLSQEFRTDRQLRAQAESLLWWAVLRLQNDNDEKDLPEEFTVDASAWEADLGDISGELVITDEGSRVNLNTAHETLLKNLLGRMKAETFLPPLLDWRDPDRLPRADGAEDAEYAELTPPVKVRNGWLPVSQELRRIRGGEEVWGKLKDEVTIWGPANFSTLDKEVFVNLVRHTGTDLDDITALELMNRFDQLKRDKQLKNLDDLTKIHPIMTRELIDKLKEFISTEGTFNPNFLSEDGFRALLQLWKIEPPEEQRLSEMDFDSREAFEQFIRSMNPAISSEQIWGLFTLQTKLWRIKASVKQGSRRLVIDAVVRREREGTGQRWKATVLRWNETWQTEAKEEDHETMEDGTEP